MKKLTFLTLSLIILVTAGQVNAVSENANEKARNNPSIEKRNENSIKDVVNTEENLTNEANTENENETPLENDCETDVKNHGQYVSCVAKTHPGGEVVSAAARSSIGKTKNENSVTPTLTPTITPSPTDDPEATPSPTLTGTPDVDEEIESLREEMQSIIDSLEDFIEKLKDLFNL